jgi:hypothetical protein
MPIEYDVLHWNDIKTKLKDKFPFLTKSDLSWRNTSNEDLLDMISQKLGLTSVELKDIIKE